MASDKNDTNDKPEWVTVDVSTLDKPLAAQYEAYKALYASMKASQSEFTDAFKAQVKAPVGKQIIFSYSFGRLAIAMIDAEAKPKAAKNAVSFASLVKATANK